MSTAALGAELQRLGVRSALVTNFFLDGYSGSPIVALDVALAFRRAGVETCLAAPRIGDPLLSVARNQGLKVVALDGRAAKQRLGERYDLVWGQHWPAYDLALCAFGVRFRYLFLSCLSPFAHLESISLSGRDATRLIFNSSETQQRAAPPHMKAGALLPNSLPPAWRDDWTAPSPNLRRVAFVSNNRVRDLDEAAEHLREQGVEVDQIGMRARSRDVDAATVDTFDALVTIGHSVQKALARRRPVFIYDRFGGDGWLTMADAETASLRNFSGRGRDRKSGDRLARAIVEGYADAAAAAPALGQWADARFDLDANLAAILASVDESQADRQISPDWRRHQAAAAQLAINLHLRRDVFEPLHEIFPPTRLGVDLRASAGPGVVDAFWPRPREGDVFAMPHEDVILEGALVMTPPREIARLTFELPGAEIIGRHGLPSPHLERLRPNDARFLASRFEIAMPEPLARGRGAIIVETRDGERVHIADATFTPVDDHASAGDVVASDRQG